MRRITFDTGLKRKENVTKNKTALKICGLGVCRMVCRY